MRKPENNIEVVRLIFILFIVALVEGCGIRLVSHQRETLGVPAVIKYQDTLQYKFQRTHSFIDSVVFKLNHKRSAIDVIDDLLIITSDSFSPGLNTLEIELFQKGRKRYLKDKVYMVSDIVPQVITPDNVMYFKHDTSFFTQGLVYHEGILYESTGLLNRSHLIRYNPDNGVILDKVKINSTYFGEGLTVLHDSLWQLTWKNEVLQVYDLKLKWNRTVFYEREGWGLTTKNNLLVASDGSNEIYYFKPSDLSLVRKLEVYDNKGPVSFINELEFVDGELWGNVLGKDYIIGVDDETGRVVKQIDCSGLIDRNKYPFAGPLNGIAYNKSDKLVYLTGKNWPFLIVWPTFFAD